MALFSKSTSRIISGSLVFIDFTTSDGQAKSPRLLVEGKKTGLVAWLLNALGIQDNSFSFSVDESFIAIMESQKSFRYFPANEGHSIIAGYNKQLTFLLAAGFFGLQAVAALGLSYVQEMPEYVYMAGPLTVFTALMLWLYSKSSRLEFVLQNIGPDRVTRTIGVRLKSSMNGPTVNTDDMKQITDGLLAMTKKQSRHYA